MTLSKPSAPGAAGALHAAKILEELVDLVEWEVGRAIDSPIGRVREVFFDDVAAVSHNGEVNKAPAADTNPASWRNWNPSPDFRFKRRSGFWLPPYVWSSDMPPVHYPPD